MLSPKSSPSKCQPEDLSDELSLLVHRSPSAHISALTDIPQESLDPSPPASPRFSAGQSTSSSSCPSTSADPPKPAEPSASADLPTLAGPSTFADLPTLAGHSTSSDLPTLAGPSTSADPPTLAGPSTSAGPPMLAGRSTPSNRPTLAGPSTSSHQPTLAGRSTSAGPPTLAGRSTPSNLPTLACPSTSSGFPTLAGRSTSSDIPAIVGHLIFSDIPSLAGPSTSSGRSIPPSSLRLQRFKGIGWNSAIIMKCLYDTDILGSALDNCLLLCDRIFDLEREFNRRFPAAPANSAGPVFLSHLLISNLRWELSEIRRETYILYDHNLEDVITNASYNLLTTDSLISTVNEVNNALSNQSFECAISVMDGTLRKICTFVTNMIENNYKTKQYLTTIDAPGRVWLKCEMCGKKGYDLCDECVLNLCLERPDDSDESSDD